LVGDVFVGDTEENDDSDAELVPGTAWDAWLVQAVKSVVRARFIAKLMRSVAWVAAVIGVVGMVSVYWFAWRQTEGGDGSFFGSQGSSRFDSLLSVSLSAASIGVAACTSVAVLVGGSALVDLYAQRLDLSIIEADDEGDIE